MSSFPPGPTLTSEWKRPFKQLAEENSQGLLVNIRSRFARFGDIYHLENLGHHTYVTKSADHLHEVLVTRAASFMKRAKDVQDFLGQGLLTSDGALWRKQRRLIQPAFNHANLKRYAEVMVALTQQMLDGWKQGDTRDLNRDMMELTLSVVCSTVLDVDASEINDAVRDAMHVLQSTAGYDVLPSWMPNPIKAKKARAVKALDELIYRIIDERKAKPGDDLVSQLLVGSDGEGMERQQLRDELITLFLAGHETTALAMTWTFFLISRTPRVFAKLHAELSSVLGGRPAGYADLEALPYTRNVVQESMRIFPPLYLLPRVAKEETEIGGYRVPEGSEVLLWVYFAHHEPRYFPRPEEFLPERFEPGSELILHPHAYVPFGAGPRQCIGSRFAMMEATLLLAAIAQRFYLRLAPGQDVRLNPRVTLGPSAPIRMELEAL